jgi:hypothetical protein
MASLTCISRSSTWPRTCTGHPIARPYVRTRRLISRKSKLLHKMKSTIYYGPNSPSYSSTGKEGSLKPDSLETPCLGRLAPERSGDGLDDLLSGRLAIIESAIEQVQEEITEREKLRDRMIETIDLQMCRFQEALNQTAPFGNGVFTVGDSKRRTSIEQQLAMLEGEKRREETSAWSETSRLTLELRGLLRERDQEQRRQRVIAP